MKDGKDEISDPKLVAGMFNAFFVNKVKKLRERINSNLAYNPLARLKYRDYMKHLSFSLHTVNETEVEKIIKEMPRKYSHGIDHITSDLLKKSASVLSVPLTRVVNLSIISGVFPNVWKTAVVKPLYKKGNQLDMCNYRPISLLSGPSMVLERVVKAQIEQYFETNCLLAQNQFGFRRHKSTIGGLISMFEELGSAAESGQEGATILYDLSAAFDCLDPEILCKKTKILWL